MKKPEDENYIPTSLDDGEAFGHRFNVWPMAAPYPEVFTKKGDHEDWWVRKLVNLQVLRPYGSTEVPEVGFEAFQKPMERG